MHTPLLEGTQRTDVEAAPPPARRPAQTETTSCSVPPKAPAMIILGFCFIALATVMLGASCSEVTDSSAPSSPIHNPLAFFNTCGNWPRTVLGTISGITGFILCAIGGLEGCAANAHDASATQPRP